MAEKITSLQNPKIKAAVKLQNRRERDQTKTFLVEGYRELLRAVDGKAPLETLFYSPDHFLGENEEALLQTIRKKGATLYEVTKEVFAKLSYRDRPDGLLAIAKQKPLALADLKLKKNPFLLIAETIEKPGNLGSILRSCDAAGVDALFVCDRRTDIYNPNVVRSSVGTLFTLPTIEIETEAALAFLKKENIPLLAATPDATARYTDIDQTGPVAVAVGSEQYGLSERFLKAATHTIQIPMFGYADSLNVAAATTLLLYEVVRQRHP